MVLEARQRRACVQPTRFCIHPIEMSQCAHRGRRNLVARRRAAPRAPLLTVLSTFAYFAQPNGVGQYHFRDHKNCNNFPNQIFHFFSEFSLVESMETSQFFKICERSPPLRQHIKKLKKSREALGIERPWIKGCANASPNEYREPKMLRY